jgi:hypothetical protein
MVVADLGDTGSNEVRILFPSLDIAFRGKKEQPLSKFYFKTFSEFGDRVRADPFDHYEPRAAMTMQEGVKDLGALGFDLALFGFQVTFFCPPPLSFPLHGFRAVIYPALPFRLPGHLSYPYF